MANFSIGNQRVRLDIRTDIAGRIDQLTDLETQKQWLWHTPDYDPQRSRISLPIGARFEEYWEGGWEEIFPNDVAALFLGYQHHDHGEAWSQPWQLSRRTEREAEFIYNCRDYPLTIRKAIHVHESLGQGEVNYTVTNRSDLDLPFLLKMHIPIAIERGDQLVLPTCRIHPVDPKMHDLMAENAPTDFPYLMDTRGECIRLDEMHPTEAKAKEFFYATDLQQGYCGVRTQTQELRYTFSTKDFPFVWALKNFEDWKDHHLILLEPCTNIPYDLPTAVANGTSAIVKAGQSERRSIHFYLIEIK